MNAFGILETYDAASIIVAADVAAKTAIVDLIELRIAKGMCGKSYLILTGEVAAVEAAIEKAKQAAAKDGMYLDSSVIAILTSRSAGPFCKVFLTESEKGGVKC